MGLKIPWRGSAVQVQVLSRAPFIVKDVFIVEEWKDYIYNYQISNHGNVRNKVTGKILKTSKTGKGYVSVTVSLGSSTSKHCIKIHRAVAEMFIPNPNNLPQVNHKNGNKNCNEYWNLEWCNNSYNMKHAYKNNIREKNKGINNHNSKLSPDDVDFIRKHYIPRDKNCGIRALSRKYNVNKETIRQILTNETWI